MISVPFPKVVRVTSNYHSDTIKLGLNPCPHTSEKMFPCVKCFKSQMALWSLNWRKR